MTHEGLTRVLSDAPLRGGFVQGLAGISQATGAFARVEVGAKLLPNLGAFAFGGWGQPTGWGAGVGVRWQFDL